MTRSIKVSGARFSKSALPRVRNYTEEIASLPSLAAWFVASGSYMEFAPNGTVERWYDRFGNSSFVPVIDDGTRNPAFITSPQGFPAMRFQGASEGNQTPMLWTGNINASRHTKVVIATLEDANQAGGMILAIGANQEDGSHALRWNSPSLISWVDAAADGGEASLDAVDTALQPALYASAFDEVAQANSVMANGEVVTVDTPAGTAEITNTQVVLSGSTPDAVGINNADMTVFDVLFFDTDVLSSANSAARDALMAYARAKLGIQPQ